ncbi:hypothetical protein TNCV_2312051 [Trichonephila clavipes]|nr:hypothetical protein TNCV_2312051 [Trichonephila clavipes]
MCKSKIERKISVPVQRTGKSVKWFTAISQPRNCKPWSTDEVDSCVSQHPNLRMNASLIRDYEASISMCWTLYTTGILLDQDLNT